MALYVRFVVSLAFGLVGLATVLKILMDRLFHDWDAAAEIKNYIKSLFAERKLVEHYRAEDALLEAEKKQGRELSTRLIDKRREQLKELDEVEYRLLHPQIPAASSRSERNPNYAEDWGSN